MGYKYYFTKNKMFLGKIHNEGDMIISEKELDLPFLKPKEKRETRLITYDGKYITKEKPVISVMITFHNQEKYVAKTIESFIKQTIQIPYEIVVIDDASIDKTPKILDKYKDKLRYFRVENHSAAKSRNFGLKKLQGDFFVFFDGDDFVYPNYLDKLYKGIQEYDVCGTRFRYKYLEEKQIIPTCNYYEFNEKNLDYCGAYNTPIMVRRELGVQLVWDDKLFCFEDWNISLQLRKLGAKVNILKDICWEYVSNGQSKWGSGEAHKKMKLNLEYIRKKHNLKTKDAKITLFSLISQDRTLDIYFDNLEKVDMPRSQMHYIIIIDSNDEKILKYVKDRVKNYQFLTTKIFFTNEPNLYESHNFIERAMRISRNLKYMVNEASKFNTFTPYFFMVEDDTKVPKNAFKKLWNHIKKDDKLVYASGVESSKCADRHLGCGWLKEENGEINFRILPKYKTKGIERFNSGGWYCWIGKTEVIQKLKLRAIEDGRKLGPDSLMVYDLQKLGYNTLTDWSIHCEHYDYIKKIWVKVKDSKGYELTYNKMKKGKWLTNVKHL